ncbi:MAG: cytidine/deoxycytidylate deaminase family protein [Firmicutes bacterium]|nr:cytidine/deoxycytidylate deaminase family protein [Bacillota bacterium]
MPRPAWDDYFMEITGVVAGRSTCLRRRVGAIIVRDNRILTTGYNGAPSGLAHCHDIGCVRQRHGVPSGERHELCRGLHAEQNALMQAAVHGISIAGGTFYVTHQPCVLCAKMMANCRITRVVYRGDYPDPLALNMLKEAGIKLNRADTL